MRGLLSEPARRPPALRAGSGGTRSTQSTPTQRIGQTLNGGRPAEPLPHLRDREPIPAAADTHAGEAARQLLGDRDRVAPVGLRPRERELELDRGADLQLPQPLARVASDPISASRAGTRSRTGTPLHRSPHSPHLNCTFRLTAPNRQNRSFRLEARNVSRAGDRLVRAKRSRSNALKRLSKPFTRDSRLPI